MNELLHKVSLRIRPEYFFWAATVCSLFLVFDPSTAPVETTAAVAMSESPTENPFNALELVATSAYVFDLKAGKALYEKNAHELRPLASLTKVMTATMALSLAPETTYIPITSDAIAAEGDSGFSVDERFLLRDLLKFMLVQSSNDSAVAVASALGTSLSSSTDAARSSFVREMNAQAARIGLSATTFLNETGLDIDVKQPGAWSTAAETAKLFGYALSNYPSIFKETRFEELLLDDENGSIHPARNTNRSTSKLPLLIASKTGYTDLAGGNLVIAFDAGFNRPVIVVVLGSSEQDRFTDVEKLVWATLAYLQKN